MNRFFYFFQKSRQIIEKKGLEFLIFYFSRLFIFSFTVI